jgi:flagellar capping protein FliD
MRLVTFLYVSEMRLVTLRFVSEMRLVTLLYVSEMRLATLLYVSEMRLVTFLFIVSILFDYGATLPCLTTGAKKDFANTRNALKTLESYLSKTVSTLQSQISKTVSTLQSQITTINGKVKTLDKDLIAIEEDFKGKFSLFNFEIRI